jgi:hypothetical protein
LSTPFGVTSKGHLGREESGKSVQRQSVFQCGLREFFSWDVVFLAFNPFCKKNEIKLGHYQTRQKISGAG